MNVTEFYNRIDGNYQDAKKRLMMDSLIEKFVIKFLNDPSFNNLKDALVANDLNTAFREAHTLKGVCLNLAFTRLGQISSVLTETLRVGDKSSIDKELVKSQYSDVENEYYRVVNIIKEMSI